MTGMLQPPATAANMPTNINKRSLEQKTKQHLIQIKIIKAQW
jgi:hypothetical protein